jgi:hypothetical protein
MAVSQIIVLDSTPLGLILNKPGLAPAEACRRWIIARENDGARIVVPEIVDYEIRRELLRVGRTRSVTADPHALDVDVILCAQVLNAPFASMKPVVATSNVRHLTQFVDARDWQTI